MAKSPIRPINPTLREYLEQRLDYERSLIAQKFELQQKALDIQTVEISRRLMELNHAHEAAVKEQARTVPREMFDQFIKDNSNQRETLWKELDKKMDELAQWRNRIDGALMLVKFGSFAGVTALCLFLLRQFGIIK